jgi:hypothetical protein
MVVLLLFGFYTHKYLDAELFNQREVIRDDAISYYNYLPSAFMLHDMSFTSTRLKLWNTQLPDGRQVNKTTMGVAYFYAPFFLATYWFFEAHHYNIDVYSPMFHFAIGLSALLAALGAMIVMRSNLKRFFSEWITSLCLVVIFLATNTYLFSVYSGTMSHIYSLFLISLMMHLSMKWYERPSLLLTVLLGLTAGWVVLIRPVNVVFCLFPLVYGQGSLRETLKFWQSQWIKIAVMIFAAFVVWIPQFLYWKYATGHFLFFTYGDERFFWTQPEIIRGWFSYRSGWLVYTPVMALSLVGMVFLYRTQRRLFYPVALIFVLNTYVIYSWWCWWYSGFGSRPMIDSYAILVLPLGALLAWVADRRRIWQALLMLLIAGCVHLNLFQSWQKNKGIIHWDGMTRELYWAVFMKDSFPKNYDQMVKRPDYDCSLKGRCE